jgi:phosphate-selective porin
MAMTNTGPRSRHQPLAVVFALCLSAAAGLRAENAPPPPVQASVPLKVTGFAQVLYNRSGDSTDSFSILRARLSLDGAVARSVRLRAAVDAVKSPVLIEAALDLSLFKGGLVRLGQFKVPFSRESLTAASDHETINLPRSVLSLSPGRDIGASGRDIGAMLQFRAGKAEAAAAVFNGSGINTPDANRRKDLAGRLVFAPGSRLKAGGSFYLGSYTASSGEPAVRRDRAGLEIEAGVSRVDIKAEWILARDGEASKRGGYVQAGVSLIAGELQAVARYDCLDKVEPSTPGRNETLTLGLNKFFAPKTKFQINLEWKRDRESARPTEFALLALFQAGF